MTQNIGLQAQLQMQQFQAGVTQFNAGISRMTAGAQQMSTASQGMVSGTRAAGQQFGMTAKQASTLLNTLGPGGAAAFGQAQAGLKKTGDDAVTTAAKIEILEKAFDQVRVLAEQGLELAEIGAQSKRVERRFAAFAEEAGGAEEVLAAFQDGAGGTVSKMDAMASASRLLQMGLVGNAQEMETVVEMATRLGNQTMSAGDRVGDFAALLANQSTPRLDNFGISSVNVRMRINELQAATADMSREEAFSQAVFEQGAISLEKLGVRIDDDAAKMERAEAKMADFRVEMGQKLAPIAGSLADVLGDLESSTLAVGIGLSTAAGIALKFSGGLGGLTGALGTSTMALGALAAAAAVLIWRLDELQKTQQEINAVVATGEDKIAAWSDEVAQMTDEGMSAEASIRVLGQRMGEATDEFNDMGVVTNLLKDAFGATDKMTRLMSDAISEVDEIALASSSTYDEYTSVIAAYNSEITDSDALVQAMSESSFEMHQRISEMTEAEKALVAMQILHKQGLVEQAAVMEAASVVIDEQRQVTGELGEKIDVLTKKTESMGRATQSVYLNQVAPAIEEADTSLLAYIASQEREESQALRNQSVYMSQVVPALDEVAKQNEETGNSVLAHAERQSELAAAARDAAQAAQDHRLALLSEAEALKDAGPAALAKAGIDRLTKSLEAGLITEEEYTTAVIDTQDAFGLVTPESRALADGIDYLDRRMAEGKIAPEEYAAALAEVGEDARDGTLDLVSLDEQFRVTTTSTEAAANWAREFGDTMPVMAQQVSDGADVIGESRDDVQGLGSDFDTLETRAAGAGTAIGDRLASGIEAAIPRVQQAMSLLAKGAADYLPSSEPKDASSPFAGLGERGKAIVWNLTEGIVDAAPEAAGKFAIVGRGLGEALVGAVREGLEEGESVIDGFLDVASGLNRIGGTLAGIFKSRELDPAEEQLDAIDDQMASIGEGIEESRDRQLEYQEALEATGMKLSDARWWEAHGRTNKLTAEQRELLAQINAEMDTQNELGDLQNLTIEERTALQEEFNRQQEQLLAFQEKQQQLQMIQQQQELLALISEFGLDPQAILGSLELGLDADIGALLEAMTRAMGEIIQQAEDELVAGDLGGDLTPPAGIVPIPAFSAPVTTGNSTEINIVLTGNSFANPAAMRNAASMLKQELAPLLRGEY